MKGLEKSLGEYAVVVAVLLLAAGGCERAPERPATLAVIGLDGGTWDLLDPWIREGKLPNLAAIAERGCRAPLGSMKPSVSPVIWTTVATGLMPEEHGITFFLRTRGGDSPRPVDSGMRTAPALWNMASRSGVDVAVIGWFVSWPAEALNGRIVSDRAHYGTGVEGRTFPAGYLADLKPPGPDEVTEAMPRFLTVDYDPKRIAAGRATDAAPDDRINFLVFDRFVRAWTRDRFYLDAAHRLLDDGVPPELLLLYLRGTDDVQHGFWKFMQPEFFEGVTEEQVRDFGGTIENYWRWVDEELGVFVDRLPPDSALLLLSDHGAGPAVGEFAITKPDYMHLSGAHRDTGIIVAAGPGVKRGCKVEGATVKDIAPTVLAWMGMPVGRDMVGRVIDDMFEAGPAVAREAGSVATWKRDDTGDDAPGADSTDPGDTDSDETDPARDDVLRHLRSLGYIN